jgi:Uncharacterized protein conserved in bacteria
MMLCPLCGEPLRAVERQGVELDHCQQCGGFWLDQGELDSLIQQEAISALLKGQQQLSATRQDREFDASLSTAEDAPAARFDVDETPAMMSAAGMDEGVASAFRLPEPVSRDRFRNVRFRRARLSTERDTPLRS